MGHQPVEEEREATKDGLHDEEGRKNGCTGQASQETKQKSNGSLNVVGVSGMAEHTCSHPRWQVLGEKPIGDTSMLLSCHVPLPSLDRQEDYIHLSGSAGASSDVTMGNGIGHVTLQAQTAEVACAFCALHGTTSVVVSE